MSWKVSAFRAVDAFVLDVSCVSGRGVPVAGMGVATSLFCVVSRLDPGVGVFD